MLNFLPKKLRLTPRFLSLMSAKTETSRRIALYGILFSFLLFGVSIYRPALLSIIDNKIYDVMHSSLVGYGDPLPLIVDIDEKSLAEFGQWPWPRYHIAHLLEKLAGAGAASVGIDILFAETDRTSLKEVQRDLREGLGIELNLEGIPDRLHDNDALLAEVLGQGGRAAGNIVCRRSCIACSDLGQADDLSIFFNRRHWHSLVWRAGNTKDGKRISFPNLSAHFPGRNVCFAKPAKVPPVRKTDPANHKRDGTDRQ